jgi:hypothetical protein
VQQGLEIQTPGCLRGYGVLPPFGVLCKLTLFNSELL